MARSINLCMEEVLWSLTSKGLIKNSQIAYLQLLQAFNSLNFLEALLEEGIVDNDQLIDIISELYQINILNKNDSHSREYLALDKQNNNTFDIKEDSGEVVLCTDSRMDVKVLNYSYARQYLKNGYFIYECPDGNNKIAINDIQNLLGLSKKYSLSSLSLVKQQNFYSHLENSFRHLNLIKSKYFLTFISSFLSAKSIDYRKALTGFWIIFLIIFFRLPTLFHLINTALVFSQNALKAFLALEAEAAHRSLSGIELLDNTSDVDHLCNLPIYTILIPLYKETEKLKSIIDSMLCLKYPRHKLDIKIILEEGDYPMLEAISKLSLPIYFHVVVVPACELKTKPKALNYAMQYAKGEYVVVYDAEDRPDEDQLLKAVAAFRNLPENYVCLQAKLNFYNANENIITKLFSIEYCIWFEYLLKALSMYKLPLPLGGTSNHFKSHCLEASGGWDAYNVTEDADLGMRLYMQGYRVSMLDSMTLEESPTGGRAWIKQRSRWIKGFIQTFYVFSRRRKSNINALQHALIYSFIGLSTYHFFCIPWIFFAIIANSNELVANLWDINFCLGLAYAYSTAFVALKKTCAPTNGLKRLDIIALIIWPAYFFLHIVASYVAIWESVSNPFSWNKTTHGTSKLH